MYERISLALLLIMLHDISRFLSAQNLSSMEHHEQSEYAQPFADLAFAYPGHLRGWLHTCRWMPLADFRVCEKIILSKSDALRLTVIPITKIEKIFLKYRVLHNVLQHLAGNGAGKRTGA